MSLCGYLACRNIIICIEASDLLRLVLVLLYLYVGVKQVIRDFANVTNANINLLESCFAFYSILDLLSIYKAHQ